MSRIRLEKLTRLFPEGGGVEDFSCDIGQGEIFVLLGPSGCGKTTTLRLVAGLETPDHGKIFFDDCDVTQLPPEQRNAAMVFQNYALFPHLNVFENVAFGLRLRRVPKSELTARVEQALRWVQLEGYERRAVSELSGGQQQRVALARALVIEPAVLLLDEPLSNLDAELRKSTREQIAALQAQLKFTTLYVTHDQEEAFALAHRIAVLRNGKCEQIGTPDDLRNTPATPFVQRFLERARATGAP